MTACEIAALVLRRMPGTGVLIVLGVVAIAGLPPLAGFTGEWLIYRGLLAGGLASSGGPIYDWCAT
jgi:formate hydrogenlyase subunit 3/multisubunit Na+/H+ antiporter MnhD subunit